jgi:hypothetical protein
MVQVNTMVPQQLGYFFKLHFSTIKFIIRSIIFIGSSGHYKFSTWHNFILISRL